MKMLAFSTKPVFDMQLFAQKSQEDRIRPVADESAKNHDSSNLAFQFADHRANTVAQRQIQAIADQSMRQNQAPIQLNKAVIQLGKAKYKPKAKKKKKHIPSLIKQTMTVRNKRDSFSSGWINHLDRATGVEAGPRKEAQKVQRFFGGTWVGGHMVNDQLGGDGSFKNIVPITSSMNGLHKSIENKANGYLSAQNGTSILYEMEILKRAKVSNGYQTVTNLPVEFQQTLYVDAPGATKIQKFKGFRLIEAYPGDGKIV